MSFEAELKKPFGLTMEPIDDGMGCLIWTVNEEEGCGSFTWNQTAEEDQKIIAGHRIIGASAPGEEIESFDGYTFKDIIASLKAVLVSSDIVRMRFARETEEDRVRKAAAEAERQRAAQAERDRRNEAEAAVKPADQVQVQDAPGHSAGAPSFPPAAATTALVGVMKLKAAGLLSKWSFKNYFLVLEEPGKLLIYTKDDRKDQKGLVLLEHTIISLRSSSRWLMALRPQQDPANKAKEYVLEATSEEEQKAWLAALVDHGCSFRESVRQGELLIAAGANNKALKKRWVILYNHYMEYFKNDGDVHPMGRIAIGPDVAIKSVGFVGSTQAVFQVTQPDEKESHFIAHPSQMESEEWCELLRQMSATKSVDERMSSQSMLETPLWYRKEGKRGRGGLFEKGWAVLMADRMLLFAFKFAEKPIFCFLVTTDLHCADESTGFTAAPFGWAMQPAADDDEDWKFHVASDIDETRAQWLEQLKAVASQHNGVVNAESIKEGHLNKLYKKKAGMARRHCVLLQDNLVYYNHKWDVVQAGVVPIYPETVIAKITKEDAKRAGVSLSRAAAKPFMLAITPTEDEGERPYYFGCVDEEERGAWHEAFSKLIASKTKKNKHDDSLLEGYLVKAGENMYRWQKRYFALNKERIFYYRKKYDVVPAGCIFMPGGTTVREEALQPFGFCVSNCHDQSGRQYHIQAANEEERNEWIATIKAQISGKKVTKAYVDSKKEGYLLRKGLTKDWKKWYVTLFADRLLISKTKYRGGGTESKWRPSSPRSDVQSSVRASSPMSLGAQSDDDNNAPGKDKATKAVMIWSGASVAAHEEEVKDNKDPLQCFAVSESLCDGAKPFILRCSSEEEKNEWISAIKETLDAAPTKLHENSVLEGYLEKTGAGLHKEAWQNRYFILFPGEIHYCKFLSEPHVLRITKTTKTTPVGLQGQFTLEGCADRDRNYKIRAKDADVRREWIDAIADAVANTDKVQLAEVDRILQEQVEDVDEDPLPPPIAAPVDAKAAHEPNPEEPTPNELDPKPEEQAKLEAEPKPKLDDPKADNPEPDPATEPKLPTADPEPERELDPNPETEPQQSTEPENDAETETETEAGTA